MAGIGEMIFNMMGKEDPRTALLQQAMGGAAGGAGTGTAAAGTPATAGAADQQQPSTYTSPPELMELYTQLMDRQRRTGMIDTGIGMLGAAFAHPENRAGIMAAYGGGGSSGSEDPMTFLTGIMDFQAKNQAAMQKAAMRASLPAIAKEHGIDLATAQYLFDTGKLDSVLQDSMKPDNQIVQQADGTYILVDKRDGSLGKAFGVPNKRDIEIIKDDRGNQFPVYKDTGERVGANNIVDGQGATENEREWRADEKDRKERGLPTRSLSQFIQETGRARAGASNLGARGVDYGNPPKDMAWKRNEDGSITTDQSGAPVAIPIVGSELDTEAKAAALKKDQRAGQKTTTTAFVNRSIDDSLNIIKEGSQNWTTPITGFAGAAAKYVPGSTAYNLSETLNTVKANIGFDKLQQMREASPTGGALGQVSDFENKLLQSTYGSLEQAQGTDQLVRNLFRVKKMTDVIVNAGITDPAEVDKIFADADAEAAAFLGVEPNKGGGTDIQSLVDKYRSK